MRSRPSVIASEPSGTTKVPHTGSRAIWRARRAAPGIAPRPAGCSFDDVVHDAPEHPRDENEQEEQQDDADHQAPGWPAAGCADFTLSSARFAACPSGLSGDSSITSSHALI